MKELGEWIKFLGKRLPVGGIVAFSLCSTWSLYNLFHAHATHPTSLYWLPAVLIELVAAWVVAQVVSQVRSLTESNIKKQDRRFFAIITASFVALAIPLIAASVWANALEFNNILLGLLFPVSSISCALGAALPDAVQKFEQRRQKARRDAADERKEQAEAEAKAAEAEAERRRRIAKLGKSADIFSLIEAEPALTQEEIGQKLGITRQTVSYHIGKLETMGLIPGRNGH